MFVTNDMIECELCRDHNERIVSVNGYARIQLGCTLAGGMEIPPECPRDKGRIQFANKRGYYVDR